MKWGVFTAQPLMVAGHGFDLFGPWHLLWLAGCVVLIGVVVGAYRVRERRRHGSGVLVLRVCAATMLGLLASEDALMISSGTFTAAWWPLHLCNFAEYLCLIYAIRPNRFCRELLLTLGLAGGSMAMLFPGWTSCPPYTWPVICGFLEHALIFSVSLCAVSSPKTSPRMSEIWKSYVFVAVYVAFFRFFNTRMGTNFGFVNTPAAGSPLEIWASLLGNPGYLVPYALAFAVGALVLHLAVALQRRLAQSQ